ncbi:hypothetical protein LQZ19_12410 [Treponema primitia]|uniref:hypothetical protein n=1 Tax=Treponema primitia TaxID=88058 RepID=UPI0039805B98
MMINETLLRLVPPILRARDFRLYTQDGRRLVDLWQYGGAAILGHTPAGFLRTLKNTAQRGLFAPLPNPQEKRFIKALSQLLPSRIFRLYTGEASLRRALVQGGYPIPDSVPFPDPALSTVTLPNSGPVLWRPFLDEGTFSKCPILIPVLPLPWPGAPQVLALEPTIAPGFPPSDLISPLSLTVATRSLWDLITVIPERKKINFPHIKKTLNQSKWQGNSIYLHYGEAQEEQNILQRFKTFLAHDFLLPPTPQDPLILPGILSPGEEIKLAKLLGDISDPGQLS